jgi:hypothetical protein
MQTKLEKMQKQLLLGTEIHAIVKQSTKLIEIVTANQEEVNKLKAISDDLQSQIDGGYDSEVSV